MCYIELFCEMSYTEEGVSVGHLNFVVVAGPANCLQGGHHVFSLFHAVRGTSVPFSRTSSGAGLRTAVLHRSKGATAQESASKIARVRVGKESPLRQGK